MKPRRDIFNFAERHKNCAAERRLKGGSPCHANGRPSVSPSPSHQSDGVVSVSSAHCRHFISEEDRRVSKQRGWNGQEDRSSWRFGSKIMKSIAWLPVFSLAPTVSGTSRGCGLVPAPSRRSPLAFVGPPTQSGSILKSDRDTSRHSSTASLWAQKGGGNGGNFGDTPEDFLENLFQAMMDIGEDGNVNVGGGGGGFAGDTPTEDDSKLAENSLASLRSFDLKPREVVEYLDRYVIQQRDAKRVLATAICDHYNHCRRCLDGQEGQLAQESYAKPNILLAGPTGVGKTYLLKTIARLIGVPFVKGDATKFSETGIVGKDAEDLVRDLVSAAGGNTTLAQYGIIYIDEVDKIASGGGGDVNMGSFRSDLARGVQNNFLKLLEDTDVPLQGNSPFEIMGIGGNRGGPKTINTRNILFIFSGAFTGLDAAIRRKKETKPFGLDLDGLGESSPDSRAENDGKKTKKRSYLQYAETKDFVNAGLEPEFVGRVPVRVALNSLDATDLKQILVQAEGSVLKQFKRDFEGYGIDMTVTDDALTRVAEFAEEEATGARGLVTILERTLRGHKYELPSTSIRKFELDARTVEEPGLALQALLSTQTEQDDLFVRLDDLKRWERYANRFVEPFSIWLTDEAIDHMISLSISKGKNKSAYSLARDHFDALPAAVKQIGESTGQSQFPISHDMAKDPKAEIANWLSFIGPGNQANGASLDDDTSSNQSTTTAGTSSTQSPSPQTPLPAVPKKSESPNVPGRDSDINNLVGADGKAPGFCSVVAKSLSFGAPGRFPHLESLSVASSMTEFDLETARDLLREEANKAGLSDQDACEEFAKVVNCMIIDIIDHASSALKEESTVATTEDNPTVDAMNAVMDFMDHSTGLFEPFLSEGVSIQPVTYCGTLGKDKLEQLYAAYCAGYMTSDEVTEDRIDMFRVLYKIEEKRAQILREKKMVDGFFKMIEDSDEFEGMEEIMKAMGGMEGMEGLPVMGNEELTPEQLKESVNMMRNLVESGQVSKEEMKQVKEMFKSAYGIDMEDLIYSADSAEVKEQLGSAGEELIEMFKIILDSTKDTSTDDSTKKRKMRGE